MEQLTSVLVIYGEKSWPIAIRLAMDLRSEGFAATPIPLTELTPETRPERFSAAGGLVVIYDAMSQGWITEDMRAALLKVRSTKPVIFVRTRANRLAPEFGHYFESVSLFDTPTFSHYQPDQTGAGGFAEVGDRLRLHINAAAPTDRRRRGFAFVSYSSADLPFVNEQLVPALAACGIGLFDYRFTARLDEPTLAQEIEREINRCAVVVAAASARWLTSEHTDLERQLARTIGRPIVAVMRPGEGMSFDFPIVPCGFSDGREANVSRLEQAITSALGG